MIYGFAGANIETIAGLFADGVQTRPLAWSLVSSS